jgi:hypothetical protein
LKSPCVPEYRLLTKEKACSVGRSGRESRISGKTTQEVTPVRSINSKIARDNGVKIENLDWIFRDRRMDPV